MEGQAVPGKFAILELGETFHSVHLQAQLHGSERLGLASARNIDQRRRGSAEQFGIIQKRCRELILKRI